jgi:intracellular sulfur oxidation DsrE/DsrF family protein
VRAKRSMMIVRRDFLTATTAVALGGIATAPARGATATSAWNRAAFEKILARTSRHRQVFASARLADGLVLHYMENSLNAYEHGFGEGPGTLHTAAVLYGPALAVTFQDRIWQKYHLNSVLAEAPPSQGMVGHVEEMVGSLLHHGNEASTSANNPYASRVAALVHRGASFFVCDNALHKLSTQLSVTMRSPDSDAIHNDLAAHLLPGAMVVPAGVAALNAAQEAHFTFFQATLD